MSIAEEMKSIANQVWRIMGSDIGLQRDLSRSIINTRALARYIIENYDLNASVDSVISAIRRFEKEKKQTEQKYTNIFKDSRILTKNNLACITLRGIDKKELKSFSRIIIGTTETKIIIDQSQIKEIREKLGRSIETIESNLGELSITISEIAIKTRGVLAIIANEISLASINIEEIIICPPEFLIYVKEEDLIKTHESLLRLEHS